MARLDIRLLGGFDVRVDGDLVQDFESDTVRALLARVALDPGRPIARSSLAELLWPDRPGGAALGNLRHALTVLRRCIGDQATGRPFLLVTPTMITGDRGADVWVDAAELARIAAAIGSGRSSVADCEHAAGLYSGPLLDGLEIDAGEAWDTWISTSRSETDRCAAKIFQRLAELRERTGEREAAHRLAQRWLEVDPWDEAAHRQVMRLLAADGARSQAIAHAARLAERLRKELGVEPSAATLELAASIRARRFPNAIAQLPSTLFPDRSSIRARPPFVDRVAEIDWLDANLDESLAGNGRVALIAGEAGTGKSMLMREFAERAEARFPRLIVARGRCNAYTGTGDPYLPFRQILGSLCGDLEQEWASGTRSVEGTVVAWNAVPAAVDAVLQDGPYLLGSFLDGAALSARVDIGFPGSVLARRLRETCSRGDTTAVDPARQQRPVLDQFTRVVQRIADHAPLLLIIDDLHWADTGTIELMWHVAGRLAGSPALVLAAYRPEVVAAAERQPTHPLAPLLSELHARDPHRALALGDSRAFVDAWLDREPNRLDEPFRGRLFALTGGHALFTVEVVQAMRDRGELIIDERGRWVPGAELDWDALPPRVEAVIAARFAELDPAVRDDLEIASVQGEAFAPALVADVRGVSATDVARRLGRLAASEQPLVVADSAAAIGGSLVDRYRFRHALFQRYLYRALPKPARDALHAATGAALAARAGDRVDEVAVELAHHFDEAGVVDAAIDHHGRAGRRAAALSATTAAIRHFERAIDLIDARSASALELQPADRVRLLGLLTGLGSCLQARYGYTAPQTDAVYERIRALASDEGATIDAAQALGAVVTVDALRARYRQAAAGSEHLLEIARELEMPLIEAVADMQAGMVQLMTGHPVDAERHLRHARERYDPATDGWLTFVVGQDVGVTTLGWSAVALWELGHPDQALATGDEAIALARRVGHPFSLAFGLAIGGSLIAYLRNEPERLLTVVDEVAQIAEREDFAFYRAAAHVHRGLGAGLTGDLDLALAEIDRGLTGWKALGTDAFSTWVGTARADVLAGMGRVDEAAGALDELERALDSLGEGIAAPRLLLARARLLLAGGDDHAAEHELRRALAITNERGAHGPGLQVATSLAGLMRQQGRDAEARACLQPMLGRFVEGVDTVDLRVARAVLM